MHAEIEIVLYVVIVIAYHVETVVVIRTKFGYYYVLLLQ